MLEFFYACDRNQTEIWNLESKLENKKKQNRNRNTNGYGERRATYGLNSLACKPTSCFFIFLYYLTGCLCHHNIMDDVTLAQ